MTISLVNYQQSTHSVLIAGSWRNEKPLKSKTTIKCKDVEHLKSEILKIIEAARDYHVVNGNLKTYEPRRLDDMVCHLRETVCAFDQHGKVDLTDLVNEL